MERASSTPLDRPGSKTKHPHQVKQVCVAPGGHNKNNRKNSEIRDPPKTLYRNNVTSFAFSFASTLNWTNGFHVFFHNDSQMFFPDQHAEWLFHFAHHH